MNSVPSHVIVVLDEAYSEFISEDDYPVALEFLAHHPNLIISRTFSKIHGLAGLRIGYMVAKPERVKMIQDLVRTEMGISVTSLAGALASLKDLEFQEFTRTNNMKNRDYVFSELKKVGLNPIPSYTSFILFPIKMPTQDLLAKMFEKGIGIRGYEIHGNPYARVSMGTMDELKLFIKALNEIVS